MTEQITARWPGQGTEGVSGARLAGTVSDDHIVGLDLIRFAAAMLVLALHFGWIDFGWIGVQAFFVMSGLLIAHVSQARAAREFFVSRFLRLAPAAWICATLSLAIGLGIHGPTRDILTGYVHSMLFWPRPPWVNIVYWTLYVEITFYAFVCVLLALGSSSRLLPMAAAIAIWSGAYNLFPAVAAHIPSPIAQMTLARFGCFFALGIAFHHCVYTGRGGWPVAILSLAGCLSQIWTYAASNGIALLPPVLTFLAMSAAIWSATRYNGAIGGGLKAVSGHIKTLGLATYPLYLIHYDAKALISHFVPAFGSSAAVKIAAVIAIVAISVVVAKCIEPGMRKPMRAALRFILYRRTGGHGPSDTTYSPGATSRVGRAVR